MDSSLASARVSATDLGVHSYPSLHAPNARERATRAPSSTLTAKTETAWTPSELARVWRDLGTGRARVIRTLATTTAGSLEIVALAPGLTEQPEPGLFRALERILLGKPMKAIAEELGVSRSTLTTQMARTLARLGFQGGTQHVPPIAAALALASQSVPIRLDSTPRASSSLTARIAFPGYGLVLGRALSSAEAEVIGLILDGSSYEHIAKARETSPRTVANQVANAYRKLGVSGRLGLLANFAERLLATHTSSALSAIGSCALPVI